MTPIVSSEQEWSDLIIERAGGGVELFVTMEEVETVFPPFSRPRQISPLPLFFLLPFHSLFVSTPFLLLPLLLLLLLLAHTETTLKND